MLMLYPKPTDRWIPALSSVCTFIFRFAAVCPKDALHKIFVCNCPVRISSGNDFKALTMLNKNTFSMGLELGRQHCHINTLTMHQTFVWIKKFAFWNLWLDLYCC